MILQLNPTIPLETPKNTFYVYEHWRPDTNKCFYVGLGQGRRVFRKTRNTYYNNVCKKLKLIGLDVEIKFIAKNLTQKEAEAFEMKRIAFWGRENLTNLTDGGDGVRNPSNEVKRKIGEASSRANKGRKQSDETRKKRSETMKGKPKSEEHKEKLRKPKSDEAKKKYSLWQIGRKLTEEHRANLSKVRKGRVVSEETRKKISEATKGKPKRKQNGNVNSIITFNPS